MATTASDIHVRLPPKMVDSRNFGTPVRAHWPRPSLTAQQWRLLRQVGRGEAVRIGDLGNLADLRQLMGETLIKITRTRIHLTARGSDALWYHRAH
ncbi:MAG: hypothetical protein ABW154_02260 [Dyella sp.]